MPPHGSSRSRTARILGYDRLLLCPGSRIAPPDVRRGRARRRALSAHPRGRRADPGGLEPGGRDRRRRRRLHRPRGRGDLPRDGLRGHGARDGRPDHESRGRARVSHFSPTSTRARRQHHFDMRVVRARGRWPGRARGRAPTARSHAADLVIVGVGVVPTTGLASAAGLACDNGIVVDEYCRTSDPAIYAAGDCTNHPSPRYGRRVRLESVDNAFEQAKTAASICWIGTSRTTGYRGSGPISSTTSCSSSDSRRTTTDRCCGATPRRAASASAT